MSHGKLLTGEGTHLEPYFISDGRCFLRRRDFLMILPRCYEKTYLLIRYSSYATLSATRSLCWHHVELYFTYLVQYAFLLER